MTQERLALRADVLVIGGGMAGAWAAASAARDGARTILVDKGYCGASGVTAAAGPGHWFLPPEARGEAIAQRVKAGLGLGEADWMERILAETWQRLPTLASHYKFGVDQNGRTNFRAVRGPEYMRALRALIADLGVTVLDHSPALELLADADGAIGGAAGVQRQNGNRPWRVRAGAVILAAGGTSFLSHLLGSRTNTGDGYLMAAEAGAELSDMEFTAAYTVAPLHSTMTRAMSYAFATYYDEAGHEIEAPFFGPDYNQRIGGALLKGRVFCSLHRLPQDVRDRLPTISPNVLMSFRRLGIDPFHDRFEITLHNDGTIRGLGGVRVLDVSGRTGIPGLFAVGDTASREKVAGAISGGGNINSAWALTSGSLAGHAAAARARAVAGWGWPPLFGLGEAGLRPRKQAAKFDIASARAAVRGEMHPYDKNIFRRGDRLAASFDRIDEAWRELRDHAAPGERKLALRETAALLATARWSLAAAQARAESRGLHRRVDAPQTDPAQARRLLVGGFDSVKVRQEAAPIQSALEAAE
jgi:succinate dehydrogenase/fumarate reductase flavoprotein subunit